MAEKLSPTFTMEHLLHSLHDVDTSVLLSLQLFLVLFGCLFLSRLGQVHKE